MKNLYNIIPLSVGLITFNFSRRVVVAECCGSVNGTSVDDRIKQMKCINYVKNSIKYPHLPISSVDG